MFHPMVAGVTIPGMGLVRADPGAVHRPEPEQQARGPQVRHLAVHDLPHVLGRARDHRLVLPGPGLQLHLPVERRPLLRAVRQPPWTPPPSCSSPSRSSSCWPASLLLRRPPAGATPARPSARLARETRKRDRGAVAAPTRDDGAPATGTRGRAGRRRSSSARRRKALATVGATAPVAWVPPDPEALGVTRRQFFNRGIVTLHRARPRRLRRRRARLPVAAARRRLRLEDQRRQASTDIKTPRSTRAAASPTTPRAACGSPQYPADALDKAKQVYSPPELAGMEAGLVALYQKCVHLGCRVP